MQKTQTTATRKRNVLELSFFFCVATKIVTYPATQGAKESTSNRQQCCAFLPHNNASDFANVNVSLWPEVKKSF
jgi:hypothetical protein